MTVAGYCRPTGLLHTTAGKELRTLASEEGSGLTISGSGSHRVYIKALEN